MRSACLLALLGSAGCAQVGDLGHDRIDDAQAETSAGTTVVPPDMLVGGDITYRNLLVDLQASFTDDHGEPKEVVATLAEHGFELARIRLYHRPGTPTVFHDGQRYRMQAGYQDLADGLRTARIAREHGLDRFITLHYSDLWTNREQQAIPSAWAALPSHEEVVRAFSDHTRETVTAFVQDSGPPAYVALGNAINDGLAGYASTSPEYTTLLRAGAQAVRQASPASRIVLHVAADTDRERMTAWLAHVETSAIDYDVLGLSLYPFWTGWTLAEMGEFVRWAAAQSGKPIVICEFGALWTGTSQGPHPAMGGEAYPVNPQGQHDYLRAYLDTMRTTEVVLAALYWDPIWIDWPGAGWVVGHGNTEWDSALFDERGQPLPALDAFL